jgi:hypothetical protein
MPIPITTASSSSSKAASSRNWTRGQTLDGDLSGETHPIEQFVNVHEGTRDKVGCLQLRGEYMYVAEGRGGFRVYDVASIANKGVSERIVEGPFSPLSHDTHVDTADATCMALPTNQPIAPTRSTPELRAANQEQAFLPIYSYAAVTDAEEGLILVNVNTLADGELRNNKLRRAVTWNEHGVLNGARHIVLAGEVAYITTARGLAVIDLADPLHPRLAAERPLTDARASAIQFRYLWVTDAEGVKLFDVTDLRNPIARPEGNLAIHDARRMYAARTYLYIAAKQEGLIIANITRPLDPFIYREETFGGTMDDVEDVVIGTTNASLFAYVADGVNGMKVLQLTSPESQRNLYGFSPAPMPELIAWAKTPSPAVAMSKGLDRRPARSTRPAGQIAVFGRLGSRPFTPARDGAPVPDPRRRAVEGQRRGGYGGVGPGRGAGGGESAVTPLPLAGGGTTPARRPCPRSSAAGARCSARARDQSRLTLS